MKRKRSLRRTAFVLIISILLPVQPICSQEEASSSAFSVNADLVSSYLWRGTKFGTGPAIQPSLELSLGNFSLGSWGSYCFTSNEGAEADLYMSYGFDFGLSLGLTDYYFPGTSYFDVTDTTGAHALEFNLGFELSGFSLSANYIFNEAGGAGSTGGDKYFEIGYSFPGAGFFIGAGDGWHTSDGDFAICNLGISSSSELVITDTFSLPVSGTVILNPDREQFHIVFGISF